MPETTKLLLHADNSLEDSASDISLTNVGSVTYEAGKFDQAFKFNGSNYVTFASDTPAIDASEDFTLDYWIRMDNAASYIFIGTYSNGGSIMAGANMSGILKVYDGAYHTTGLTPVL